MHKLTLYSLSIIFSACSYHSPQTSEKPSDFPVKLVLHSPISIEKATEVKEKIGQAFTKLSDEFNLSEKEVFNVHIWQDYNNYLSAQKVNTGASYEGSAGYVFSKNDLAVYYNDDMVENIEHEFIHAASLHLNNEFGNNPRWLWEAVAIYESGEFTHPQQIEYLRNGDFPSLSELNGMLTPEGANKIYQVGYLLSEFIIEKWGRAKYLQLIQESGHLNNVLSVSEKEFEEEWKQFVNTKYIN